MKMKFNKEAAQKLAGNTEIMAHTMFVAISGAGIWKGTSGGLMVGFAVWFALQGIAFFLRSLTSDDAGGSG